TKIAEKIVAKSKPTVTKVMELVPYAKFHSFKAGVAAEANAFGDVFGNEVANECISAYVVKRKPNCQDKELREELSMNIYVLLKRTFDTEDKIVVTDGEIEDDGAEFIINPYDEYAVEEAIVQRDKHGGEVTVVTIGDEDSEKQLRTALAMG